MILTVEKLRELGACDDGIDWFDSQSNRELKQVVEALMTQGRSSWANWLIVRLLSQKQKSQYAIFAAESVLHIFEKKYPTDMRPREAIKAAREYLEDPSEAKLEALRGKKDAAYAANAYANAAAADAAAAAAAAAAAYAADAYAAAAYAAYAYANAAYAADAVDDDVKRKIIDFGLELLEESK
jgi:hypothetical protein